MSSNTARPTRVVIACGGTGGHLFPGVAVGEELVSCGHEVMLIVSEKKIDEVAVHGHSEFLIERIGSVAMPKVYSPAIVLFLLKVMSSVAHCRRLFRKFHPEVILGMGGFTSTAPVVAGRMAGAGVLLHESNVIPGKANLLNAKFANQVLLGFSEAGARFPRRTQTMVTGTPVRASMRRGIDRAIARAKLGLRSDAPVLAVMGGSQGASAINHALCRIAPKLRTCGMDVIHLTGERDAATVAAAYHQAGITAHVAAFYHAMEEVYAACDLVVARAGASSLSEIDWFGLPSILIPYPYAADDHQTHNAEVFAKDGAAIVIREGDRLAEQLAQAIESLSCDETKRLKMGQAARRHDSGGAAARVADAVEQTIARKTKIGGVA